MNMGTKLRTALIVDDHPLFCDALTMTLSALAPDLTLVTSDSLTAALTKIDAGLAPDLIVLDLNLPDVDGLDGLIRLRAACGATVLVVSSLADARIVDSVILAGASGYVPKHSERDAFRDALETVSRGEVYLPNTHQMPSQEAQNKVEDAVERLGSLTNQQGRILQLICQGKLNKQIAYDLSIAETTVKAHVTAIMRKLGVQSRTQAVLLASQARFENVLQDAVEQG